MNILDKAYGHMMCAKHVVSTKVNEFLTKERGAMGIIEIVIIIAVVLVIGVLFKDAILGFVNDLMDSVFADPGEFDPDTIKENATTK